MVLRFDLEPARSEIRESFSTDCPVDPLPASGAVPVSRLDREEALALVRRPPSFVDVAERALPMWNRGHRNLLPVVDAWRDERGVAVLMDVEAGTVTPPYSITPMRAARVVVELADVLLFAAGFGLRHGELSTERLRFRGGHPLVFICGDHEERADARGLQAILRDVSATLRPPFTRPVAIDEALEPGLSIRGIAAILREYLDDPATAESLGLGDALRLLERFEQTGEISIGAAEHFFEWRSDLLRHRDVEPLAYRVLEHPLLDALRGDEDGDRARATFLLSRMPSAERRLIELVADEAESSEVRARAIRILVSQGSLHAGRALAGVLSSEDLRLARVALWALDRLPRPQPLFADGPRGTVTACPHTWADLIPFAHAEEDRRFCPDCRRDAVRARSLSPSMLGPASGSAEERTLVHPGVADRTPVTQSD